MEYDVAIVGCGTTGATAAQYFARGLDVVVLDSRQDPWPRTSSGVYLNHNFVNLPELPGDPFEREFTRMRYVGLERVGLVDAGEFNQTFGYTVRWETLHAAMVKAAESAGAHLLFQAPVQEARVASSGVILTTRQAGDAALREVRARLLLLATGSHFDLQQALGFARPACVEGIQAEYAIDNGDFDAILGAEYNFHYDHRISHVAPFWITALDGGFHAGFGAHHASPAKLTRVLAKYPRVQELLDAATPTGRVSPVVQMPREAVPAFSRDRVLLLGECAGLIHPFFYEGIWEGRVSARAAWEVVSRVEDAAPRAHPPAFTADQLRAYDQRVQSDLLEKFIGSGKSSALLFYGSKTGQRIFDYYCKCIAKYKWARAMIVEAGNVDAVDFNPKNDRAIGEQIFKEVPFSKKILWGPRFFRAA